MDDLVIRLQKQAERGTYIPDGPELMRDVITELAALSCKNSQLLSTNYDLHKERDRQIDEIEFLRSRLAAHEYIPTPEERRKQEVLAKENAAEVIANETELKRLRLEIESLHSRLAEAERNEGTLLGMIRHQRDVLRECLPYLNESMAGRRPGRSADDIRAAVKALTTDSASSQPSPALDDGATQLDGLTCKASGDRILIAISATALKAATDNHPEFWDGETDRNTVAVIDPQEWLKSVTRHITDEREDGSSLLADMFDAAIKAAVENGEEGCEEVTADNSDAAPAEGERA